MTDEFHAETPLPAPDAPAETVRMRKGRGLWADAFRELIHKRSAVIGLTMLGVLVIVAIFAPLLAPYDPNDVLIG